MNDYQSFFLTMLRKKMIMAGIKNPYKTRACQNIGITAKIITKNWLKKISLQFYQFKYATDTTPQPTETTTAQTLIISSSKDYH